MNNTAFNHPAGILFAFLNEGASDVVAACPTYATLAARYRSLSVNGLVSWASNRATTDKCLASADVVSFNSYPGYVPTLTTFVDCVHALT